MNCFNSLLIVLILFLTPLAFAEGGKKESGGAHKDGSSEIVETYWEVPTLIIPIVKGDEVFAYVRILVQVMTKDATSIYPYKVYEPILKDRFFRDIYGALCDQWLPGKSPDQNTIEKRLQRVLDKTVGPDKLRAFVVNFYFYKPDKK